MATEGLSRKTVILTKAPEDLTTTAIITAACKVGSVLISKTYFMPVPDGKGEKSPQIV
jgi:hypothetical protein